ncbi:1,2-phenylacetyl-CoA epoxidase subunit PaaE [Xenorhabdus nematophila]|uniref:Phenylacetic acid degradation protein with NADP-linked, 2Fe-2S ferredoxin-like and riboflavin synthase-like domains n=1 Tax=Xenorhabdus nematophila (strain ATCC 19061 / DSM 3370 / CCUG 14189 / LMG 1036 / NCIMB 9965 / AN6) TaxID=406817 RepID=D3VFX6_XENNA|nr:1,2-phenylacetyl-CoA epoxidase subunit PaaE [Xenorhabdus nematophila]CEF29856.1 putative phenylacetic acid degradation protein with NADP-linked, 2Fe-2S ferredoxin-like and riboflavin synthase-like domains [Xenorhabdus nematophila str. Websteri]AYA41699.1 phenylacetate-CoA oxygenase/reductase subunit PaaK [Xenorhabdus nematophila]MCB4424566.1 phenylacetate-CoA oxygenase/reductase subunit PaaK [Xenorhabdus nematophila]CBJ92642.1 putative phenylacetic acid degradation protein with NADP-linked, 
MVISHQTRAHSLRTPSLRTHSFHRLSIAAIERETPEAVTVTLHVPNALKKHFSYQPGQHLTLKAQVNGEELRRCYSICSSPLEGVLQIGVKAIYQGRFSTFINQQLKVGDELEVMLPQGNFGHLPDAEQQGHYLAIAAGSGITPILSIIKSTLALEPNSTFTLIYGNRTSRSIMFKEVLSDLKNRYLNRFQVLYLFSQEATDSPLFNGRIDTDHLHRLGKTLLNFSRFDHAFLCGPEAMLDDAHSALEHAGIPAKRIHSERFNTGRAQMRHRPANLAERSDTRVEIHLDGRTFNITMNTEDDSILDAALRQGADLPYACKGGVCATCKCQLKSGEVEMNVNYSLEPDQLAAGYILSCQAWPKGDDVVVDFDV